MDDDFSLLIADILSSRALLRPNEGNQIKDKQKKNLHKDQFRREEREEKGKGKEENEKQVTIQELDPIKKEKKLIKSKSKTTTEKSNSSNKKSDFISPSNSNPEIHFKLNTV
jgi:hypothetical protein